MKVTVFEKTINLKDGRTFKSYRTRLTKKDGSGVYCGVMFPKDDTPKTEEFPLVIAFDKKDANISQRKSIKEETGEVFVNNTLWLKKFVRTGEEYVDHSLDEFED